ncbi:class I SAM-dependent methyltransferase [Lutibacter sp.]
MNLSKEQQVQDNFYKFPYHYAVQFKPNFSMVYLFDWGLNYASTIELLLQKITLNKKEVKSIIDIGCGEGRLSRELCLKFPKAKITGVDYSKRPIQLAKALNHNLNIEFIAANIIEDNLPQKYNVATLMEVYEHIEPKKADFFLKGVSNALEKGGVLHLTVPHENIPVAPHHFRHFSIKTLTAELEKYFDIIEVIPFEKISPKRKWLMRIFANKFFILNHKKWNNKLYNYYKKKLFYVKDESQCQRIYVQCKKR